MKTDEKWMRRALVLAGRGRGKTSPNPMVGAVLVRGERKLAEGWHARAGGPHAEIATLSRARHPRGGTLYVTLEPCCTHGRTPPCTEEIRRAGIRRVVVGATDPNPRHAGRGIRILRRSGLRVVTGVLDCEATNLNRAFNHWITTKRPWVIAKAAMTLDGKIATKTGDSKWITGQKARKESHRLRREVDAILVGVNTVRRDNPRLTARLGKRTRPLLRVVLDPRARTPLRSHVLRGLEKHPTLIVVSSRASGARIRELLTAGALVWKVPTVSSRFTLKHLLNRLGKDEITSLLVEGGSDTLGHFFDAGCVNQIFFFYAPKLVGGTHALKAVGGAGIARMRNAPVFPEIKLRRVGEDLLIVAYV